MSTQCTYEKDGTTCGAPTLLAIHGEPRCTEHNPVAISITTDELDALNAYLRTRKDAK